MQRKVVKSSGRGFEILEAFERHRRPLGLTELARELGYPKSSTAALLKSMVFGGYLGFDRDSFGYFPTTRINTLGAWIPRRLASDGADLALMERIGERTGEAVVLCAQSDEYVQYLHVIDSTIEPCLNARVGTLRPIASVGTGIVLLSTMPDAQVERVLRRLNHTLGRQGQGPIDAQALDARIAQARAKGRLFTSHPAGASSLAIALPAAAAGRRLVVGVIGPTARLQDKTDAILSLVLR